MPHSGKRSLSGALAQAIAIKDMIATKVGKLGENISVRRFARFKLGDTNWTVAQAKLFAEE